MTYRTWVGSGYGFNRFRLDARQYISIGRKRSLAFQFLGEITNGDVAFHLLPFVGGQNLLRGYLKKRYRDKVAALVQAKYRADLFWRIGWVAFAGVGDVTSSVGNFGMGEPKISVGAGSRFKPTDDGVRLRLDFGAGRDGGGMYLTVLGAFFRRDHGGQTG